MTATDVRRAGPGLSSRAAAVVFLLLSASTALAAPAVQGRVQDREGRPIPAAVVIVAAGNRNVRAATDADGRFSLPWDTAAEATLTVDAAGYRPLSQPVPAGTRAAFTVVLAPAAVAAEQVTVTATLREQRVADTPASIAVLSSAALATTGALAIDDALRQVPGFTLFRRASSRYANPTTQGASLRGVGGSGAGRATVIDDGVSLADPFGGWIYWTRVPRIAIERVEILRGGGSDLYGGAALAGVVQVVRQGTERPHFDAELAVGPDELADASLSAGARKGAWGLRLGGGISSTSGYIAIPKSLRGPVDEPLSSFHHSLDAQVERNQGWGRLFLRGTLFREHRENGTAVQENETALEQGVLGLDASVGGGSLTVRGDLLSESYDQSFSAIAADRATERKTSLQHVPSRAGGVSLRFTRPLGANNVVVAGVERRGVRGVSHEDLFSGAVVNPTRAGGRQRTTGAFVEDLWSPWHRLTLTGALRNDRWRNFDGERASGAVVTELPDRSEQAWSPRGTALVRLSDHVSLTGAAYRAFRPPTLNELFRSFRVGNVLTGANPSLEAERLSGVDVGALFSLSRFSLRATRYSMDVSNTVANVTLSTTPALITRERRNLGSVRSRGVELEAEGRLFWQLTLSGSWMTTSARVTESPADPGLLGLRVPQVPRGQGTVQLRRSRPDGLSLGVQARFSAAQFEDDQNRLALAGYRVVDVFLEHPLVGEMGVFASVENVANQRIEIGRTPVLTIGPPRSFRIGLRVRMGRDEGGKTRSRG